MPDRRSGTARNGGAGARSGSLRNRVVSVIVFVLVVVIVSWLLSQMFGKGKNGNPDGTNGPDGGKYSPAATAPATSEPTDGATDGATSSSNGTLPANQRERATGELSKLKVSAKIEEGYKRTVFGKPWADVDHNGCDTRNDILRRDLMNAKFKAGSDCIVLSGDLKDPYTGKTIHFVRGHGALVDIDHVVALGNVFASGGGNLPADKREAIANDPSNLIAVDAPANRQKGDKDASEWLPSNTGYKCQYVIAQIHVKTKYGLSVTNAEKSAMTNVLSHC